MTSSQNFESYVPVYDTVPDTWEEARPFLVEQLKKISEGVNVREIGWLLEEEALTGQQFIPGISLNPNLTSPQFRSVLRKVIEFIPLAIGVNTKAHGITVDNRFTLIELYGSATDAVALTGNPINQPNITYDATNIYITSAAAYTRAYAFISYIQEL